jgi:hypothetical protein
MPISSNVVELHREASGDASRYSPMIARLPGMTNLYVKQSIFIKNCSYKDTLALLNL